MVVAVALTRLDVEKDDPYAHGWEHGVTHALNHLMVEAERLDPTTYRVVDALRVRALHALIPGGSDV